MGKFPYWQSKGKEPKKFIKNNVDLCHTMALPFTLKKVSSDKLKRIMKTQIFHHAKI